MSTIHSGQLVLGSAINPRKVLPNCPIAGHLPNLEVGPVLYRCVPYVRLYEEHVSDAPLHIPPIPIHTSLGIIAHHRPSVITPHTLLIHHSSASILGTYCPIAGAGPAVAVLLPVVEGPPARRAHLTLKLSSYITHISASLVWQRC